MMYYKISFVVVLMLSIVCFSCDDREAELLRQFKTEECTNIMETTFSSSKSTKGCVQHAITFLKLHGKHAFKFVDDVIEYYETFHDHVILEKVLLPAKYCENKESNCLNELKIFEEVPPKENQNVASTSQSNPGTSQSNPGTSQSNPGNSRSNPVNSQNDFGINQFDLNIPGGIQNWLAIQDWVMNPNQQQTIEGVSEGSSSESSNNDSLAMTVLKNALYYHVIVDSGRGIKAPEDDAKIYFHDRGSRGFGYLSELARTIKMKKHSLISPSKFCKDRYLNPSK